MSGLAVFADRYEHPDQRLKAGREWYDRQRRAVDALPDAPLDICTSLVDVALDRFKGLRMVAYRLLRHCLRDKATRTEYRRHILALPIDTALTQTFCSLVVPDVSTASAGGDGEKGEALVLLRHLLLCTPFLNAPSAVEAGTIDAIIGLLISLAEANDDPYHVLALETLCELVHVYPEVVTRLGGLRPLIAALTEKTHSLKAAIHDTVLHLMDSAKTRHLLRPSIDIESIFADVTDSYSKGTMTMDNVKASLQAAVHLLSSWSGLFYFCAHKQRAIASFVEALRTPQPDVQKMCLSALRQLFGRDRTSSQRSYRRWWHHRPREQVTARLHDQYSAVLLMILIEAGLLTALTDMIENGEQDVIDASTLLANEVLMLSNRLLPKWDGFRAQTLPKLFDLAATFQEPKQRYNAVDAILHIDRPVDDSGADTLPQSTSDVETDGFTKSRRDRAQQQMKDLKTKMGTAMDDAHFRQLLNDTNVLILKDHQKWQWGLIIELLEGPLYSARRLDEVLRSTKFIKRLISFFRPQIHQFSDLSITAPGNERYVRYGVQLMQTLMHSAEGTKYLADMGFLTDLTVALQRVEPMEAVNDTDPLFSRERMTSTLTKEYFTMIGMLSANERGNLLLETSEVYTLFYRLAELRSRDDIVRAIITCLNYDVLGHPRIILTKCLTSANRAIRLYATRYLRHILFPDALGSDASHRPKHWVIDLLIGQLYDPNTDVADEACVILDEACTMPEHLQRVIDTNPALDHLGVGGHVLKRRFLSHPTGFNLLWHAEESKDSDTIPHLVQQWSAKEAEAYANRMQFWTSPSALALPPADKEEASTSILLRRYSECHLLGDLAQTDEGAAELQEILQALLQRLRQECDANHFEAATLPADLWSIGHIGASESGARALYQQDKHFIKHMSQVAYQQSILSLKGIALYALSLLAQSDTLREALAEAGWISVSAKGTCAIVLPANLDLFCSVPEWDVAQESVLLVEAHVEEERQKAEKDMTSSPSTTWVEQVGNLGNNLVATAAMKELTKAKASASPVFAQPSAFAQALHIATQYRFRLSARRFIFGLFDQASLSCSSLLRYHRSCQKKLAPRLAPLPSALAAVEKVEPKTAPKSTLLVPSHVREGFVI